VTGHDVRAAYAVMCKDLRVDGLRQAYGTSAAHNVGKQWVG
jgi:hypothetical protein